MLIRALTEKDRNQIEKFVRATQNFSEEEKNVAMELVDLALNPNQSDYFIRVAELDGKTIGYYCVGKRALTKGVYDLYWIVIDPDEVNKGYGTKLLNDAENYIQNNGGYFIWVETSSREDYKLTREFYLKNNYQQILVVDNFYKENDGLIVFAKTFKK